MEDFDIVLLVIFIVITVIVGITMFRPDIFYGGGGGGADKAIECESLKNELIRYTDKYKEIFQEIEYQKTKFATESNEKIAPITSKIWQIYNRIKELQCATDEDLDRMVQVLYPSKYN